MRRRRDKYRGIRSRMRRGIKPKNASLPSEKRRKDRGKKRRNSSEIAAGQLKRLLSASKTKSFASDKRKKSSREFKRRKRKPKWLLKESNGNSNNYSSVKSRGKRKKTVEFKTN